MNKQRIAVYVRVSSKKQELGLSIDGQLETISKYIHEHYPNTDFEEYIEPAKSGSNIRKRKVMQELLDNLKYFDILIVWKMDRLTRDVEGLITIAKLLNKNFVKLISIVDNVDIETHYGMSYEIIRTVIASDVTSAGSVRTKLGLLAKARKGEYPFSKPPFGYLITDDKKLVPDIEKQNLINHIFYYYYELKFNKNKIVEELLKVFNSTDFKKYEKIVHRTIQNRDLYLGRFTYLNEDFSELILEAVIKKDFNIFDEIKQQRHDHLEIDIICARCKSALTNNTTVKKYKTYKYKVCRICNKRVNQDSLENLIKVANIKPSNFESLTNPIYQFDFATSQIKRVRKTRKRLV